MRHNIEIPVDREELWQKARKKGIGRRYFLQLLAAGGAAAVLMSLKSYDPMPEKSDCIIIGSGPVGISAAVRLAQQGLNVLVLEAGKSIIQPAGAHFRNQPVFREKPDSYFDAIGPYLKPVDGRSDAPLPGLADSAMLGGQGVIWTNNCPRASTFERWPALSAQQWEKRYAEAEVMLQVLPDPTADSKTGKNVQARLKDVLPNGRMIRGLPFSGRILADNNTHFNAPWDILQAAEPSVRERIEIRAGVRAMRVVHKKGRGIGIDIGGSGKSHLPTKALLLAGGAVGTPRLLHDSGIRPPALGRGFSFHALLFGQVVLAPELSAAAGTPDKAPRLWIPPASDSPWHIQVLRDTNPVPATEAVDNPHRLLEFQAFLPAEFRDENRFIFQDNGKIEVQFTFSEKDQERMKAVEQDVRRLAAHLGHWRKGGGEPAWVPQGTAHLAGTCRMDRPGWEGVTDPQGLAHDFKGLYIASVGLFPGPVAVNPTLTAVALALNTAEALAKEI